jgi:omega-6 fatty acid desaturase (delta-12 desaturase)
VYLIRNASGQKTYPKWTNHFNPDSIIFDARHRKQVIASDIGIGITLSVLAVWAYYRGLTEVTRFYIAPYLWVNHWCALTLPVYASFLRHTQARRHHLPPAHRPYAAALS